MIEKFRRYWLMVLLFALCLLLLLSVGYMWSAKQKMKDKLSEATALMQIQKYIPEVSIAPGFSVPSVKTVPRSELDRLVKKITASDKNLKKLIKTLRRQKRSISTLTQAKAVLLEKLKVKNQESASVKNGKHSIYIENTGIRLAQVWFDLKNPKNPWTIEFYPWKLHLNIIQSVATGLVPDRVGIKASIKSLGKSVPLKIKAKTVYAIPRQKLPSWGISFTPFKLELMSGVFVPLSLDLISSTNVHASIGFHFIHLNFGKNNVFRFAGLHLGYAFSQYMLLHASPASLNIGHFIPFLSDTYITLSIGFVSNFQKIIPILGINIMTTL